MSATKYYLRLATEAAQRLKERLAEEFADDPDLARDTIEGEIDLNRLIERAVTEKLVTDGMVVGIGATLTDLTARRDRLAERSTRIKAAIEAAMLAGEIKSLVTPAATLTIQTGQAAVIFTDEQAIPPQFLRHPPPVPDKKAINAALEAGVAIPGALLSNPLPHLVMRKK